MTATYSRTSGENASPPTYQITATLSAGVSGALNNYNVTNVGAEFTINKRLASVTPNAANKTFGEADPTFTGTLLGFVAADGVTATYSRTAGENVAGSPYIISPTLSPAAVLSNYDVTYNTANFTINKANATCIVNGYSGTYDSAAHGATGSCTGVAGMSDVLTGLSIAPTTYTNVPGGLVQWSFTNNNYMDQSGDATVTILQAAQTITVTQEAPASAYYGNSFTVAATAGSGLAVSIGSSGSCSASGSGSALITMTARVRHLHN